MSKSMTVKTDILRALLFTAGDKALAIPIKHIDGEVTHGVYLVPKEYFDHIDEVLSSEAIQLLESDFE